MARLITGSINVKKIDKDALIEGKNGALYLNISMFVNEEADQYDNHGMITQDIGRERRDKGEKIILGNVRDKGEFGGGRSKSAPPPARGQQHRSSRSMEDDDSIPF